MGNESAGLLMCRVHKGEPEFLLVHPGGSFWKNRDVGVWTIPKGEIQAGEDALAAAKREFEEELGLKAEGPFLKINPAQMSLLEEAQLTRAALSTSGRAKTKFLSV